MRSIGRFCLCALLLCVVARAASADVVLQWNVTMLQTLAGQSPFATARYAAITQLAVFEAVNAITGDYEPYLGTVVGAAQASPDAAAAAAAHAVLAHYFPAQAGTLAVALAASLTTIADGPGKDAGIAIGAAAAQAMIAARASDGAANTKFYEPPEPQPGQWQKTPTCPTAGGSNYHWREVTPFALASASQFRLGPPPALAEGEYSQTFAEVASVGDVVSAVRTLERELNARFYAAFSPVSWANSAARQVATAQNRSLAENARALALLNVAVSDAAVATFDTKYHYNFWRPETAIASADIDGNPKTAADGGYVPLIAAPCFPGYPSAHGTLSGAAREVLERLYGPSGHDITFTSAAVPQLAPHYTAFKRITEDISDARVFGGIHFRFDQDGGERQGTRVGAYVYKHYLRPVHPN